MLHVSFSSEQHLQQLVLLLWTSFGSFNFLSLPPLISLPTSANRKVGCAVTSLLASELTKEDALGSSKQNKKLKKDKDGEAEAPNGDTPDETFTEGNSRQS